MFSLFFYFFANYDHFSLYLQRVEILPSKKIIYKSKSSNLPRLLDFTIVIYRASARLLFCML
jgi:hypothetical protein